jgi:hypothetical protein
MTRVLRAFAVLGRHCMCSRMIAYARHRTDDETDLPIVHRVVAKPMPRVAVDLWHATAAPDGKLGGSGPLMELNGTLESCKWEAGCRTVVLFSRQDRRQPLPRVPRLDRTNRNLTGRVWRRFR